WAKFRDECPIAHSTEYGGSWMPVRYDDVVTAARNIETFSSAQGVSVLKIANTADSGVVRAGGPPIGVDPPMHGWTRRLMLAAMSPKSVLSYEPGTRALCQRLVSEIKAKGHGDAAVDYAQQLPVRVIGALEAMAVLDSGTVQVTPDMLRMAGTSGDPNAAENAAAALSNRIGAGARYALSIRYDRRLDPALDLPDGQECVRRLNLIMSESEIGFEPGKSTIAGDPQPTLARLAEAMTECADFQIEAGGHTDAQGSQGFNADLSRARAQALVAAMAEAGIDTANLTARGYGESQPIASNDTEAGREENRRIEFRLLSEMPIRNTPLPVPILREGVTSEPVAPLQGPPATDIATSSGMAPEGGAATSIDAVQGPQRPQAGESRAVPATVGVSEQVPALDDRDETVRLPVQTPGADTPRPSPRPEDAATSATGQEQQDTTPAP
ncbi:MAG: OmpA family protein, partial [Paracoccus sp. (in: a-proteobacteria)]